MDKQHNHSHNSLSAESAWSMISQLETGDIELTDIRSFHEFSSHHIEGAVSRPVKFLHFHIHSLHSEKTYLVYCENGEASRLACHLMMSKGLNVYFLEGGLQDWMNEGYPIEQ